MNKRILVVDDDLYMRELYEEVLKGEGYEVETAVDGEDGLRKLGAGGFDLMLLDMMMPNVDGMGVLDGLAKGAPDKKKVTIILLSNLGQENIVAEAMKKGASDYLVKADVTPEQLLKAVGKHLGK